MSGMIHQSLSTPASQEQQKQVNATSPAVAAATSQRTDTSKNTTATLKCHALHSYAGTIFGYDNLLA